jgi:hypothetical protein
MRRIGVSPDDAALDLSTPECVIVRIAFSEDRFVAPTPAMPKDPAQFCCYRNSQFLVGCRQGDRRAFDESPPSTICVGIRGKCNSFSAALKSS